MEHMEQLKRILEAHKELLLRVLIITREQPLLIEGDDIVALMNCIEARQKVIDQIDEIRLPETAAEQARVHFPKLVSEISQLLTAIRQQDDENGAAATNKLAELRKQLQALHANKQATAYEGMPLSQGATYLDKKG